MLNRLVIKKIDLRTFLTSFKEDQQMLTWGQTKVILNFSGARSYYVVYLEAIVIKHSHRFSRGHTKMPNKKIWLRKKMGPISIQYTYDPKQSQKQICVHFPSIGTNV